VRDRIAAGVRARLELFTDHREAVRRIMSFLALPGHKGEALRLTWDTVDAIWYAAGDASHDFNYYTKRGLLAPVYGTTVLYWLSDESEGFADTWDYLDRRIGDVLKIPATRAKCEKAFKETLGGIPSPFKLCRLILKGLREQGGAGNRPPEY